MLFPAVSFAWILNVYLPSLSKALEEYQEAEDSKEDLAKIPLLSREDIGKSARRIVNEENKLGYYAIIPSTVFSS